MNWFRGLEHNFGGIFWRSHPISADKIVVLKRKQKSDLTNVNQQTAANLQSPDPTNFRWPVAQNCIWECSIIPLEGINMPATLENAECHFSFAVHTHVSLFWRLLIQSQIIKGGCCCENAISDWVDLISTHSHRWPKAAPDTFQSQK